VSAEHQQNEEVIYYEAIGKAPAEREAYLRAACSQDTALLARVRALLEARNLRDGFLESVPWDPAITLDTSVVTEGSGTVIGRYKLLEKIGEGGMAVVYMAEQEQPIRRKVALKIIKLGMDTRQVIARFEAERQALALMDHPSIARVLDAGATETGRPYFVMELVQGVSITEYCDKNNLSTKDRLALFIQVCQAVQHAHTKGIIHRDIKPSNVMVTHHDGKPVPKVIDFGIAKATNQRLTEKTLFTRYAHIIGTPAYMSPEQAELSDLDIDTRTDIYSLGVLLYELLTGTTPFSEEELRKAGYIEMQRVIREQEPVKPSTRIRTAHVAQPPSAGVTPGGGGATGVRGTPYQQVRGDLDWIVMKSLEKDRLRRYEAAEGLALDIQRHLEHRPVLAHAPSTGYRFRKYLRRHRSHVLAGLAMAVVASFMIVILMAWNRDRFQFDQAERLKHEAILSQARQRFTKAYHVAALEAVEPILDSRHVGSAARLLHDQILDDLHERVSQCTQRIAANPMEASAYSERAHYYDCLHERGKARGDMAWWSAIQRQRAFWDSCFGPASSLKRVVNGPSGYQIVFSAERSVSETPMLSIAFGQKGRREMKVFEIPMFVTSLFGFCLLSGLEAPPAYADFTFGEPVNLKSVVPAINVVTDGLDCFSYDGLEIYSTTYVGPSVGAGNWDIRVLRRASNDQDWGPPESLGPSINTIYVDADASISADGLTLYFNSSRPGGYGSSDIYMATRPTKNAPWGQAVNLGSKVNSPASDAFPWISADGLELYFSSSRSGGYGSSDIYVTKRATQNDPWGTPVNLGAAVNSAYTEGIVSLSPDGLLLVFDDEYVGLANDRPGGYGGCDIWMSRRASLSAPWQTPVSLGPHINSSVDDEFPRFSPDGRMLYFQNGSSDPTTWVFYQVPIIPIVDFNGDGKVDGNEVLGMAQHWGQSKSLYDIGLAPLGDGVVDLNDLTVLAGYIGADVNDPTLVAHWALDEADGTTAHDSTGKHDATLLGGTAWQPADGKMGGALAFDGIDDCVYTNFSVLDAARGPFSVIAWVKGKAEATSRVIMSQGSASNWLAVDQLGMLTTDLKSHGTSGKPLTSGAYVVDDQWHRVAMVWDGQTRALLMDGVEVARDSEARPSLTTWGNELHIGADKDRATGAFWWGLIDEVRIYTRVVAP
jgi:serine/threonine protein kinase